MLRGETASVNFSVVPGPSVFMRCVWPSPAAVEGLRVVGFLSERTAGFRRTSIRDDGRFKVNHGLTALAEGTDWLLYNRGFGWRACKRSGGRCHRRKSGLLAAAAIFDAGVEAKVKEVRCEDALRSAFGCVRVRELEGRKVAFLARHGRGHPPSAERTQFPGQYSWIQAVGCGANCFGVGSGFAERRTQAVGFRDSGSVFRPHTASRRYVFWRRDGRAHRVC